MYKSPFRTDSQPSCSFWISKSGNLVFHDFGISKKYGIVEFVRAKFNLSSIDAQIRLHKDSPLFNVSAQLSDRPQKEELKISFTPGNLEETSWYWSRFRIPIQIVKEYCFFAKTLYRNEAYYSRSTTPNPIFIYKFPSGNVKVYRPLSPDKTKKWWGNTDSSDVGGMYQLPQKGNLLIITSSIKDVMVLRQHEFNAVCFMSESVKYETVRPIIAGLKKRFKHVLLFFDNDAAGLSNALTFSNKSGIGAFWIKKTPKDISDFQKKYGINSTNKYLKKLLSRYYGKTIK